MSFHPVLRIVPVLALAVLHIPFALAVGSSRRPPQRLAQLQIEQPSQEKRDAGSDIALRICLASPLAATSATQANWKDLSRAPGALVGEVGTTGC